MFDECQSESKCSQSSQCCDDNSSPAALAGYKQKNVAFHPRNRCSFPKWIKQIRPIRFIVQIQRSNCQLCKIFVAMRPLIPPLGQFHLNATLYLNTFPNYQLLILIINQCHLKSTTWRHPAFDSIGNANRCRSFNKLETSLVDCKFHSTRPQVSIGQLMRRNAAIQSTKWSKRSCGCPQQSSCFTLVNSSSFVKSY